VVAGRGELVEPLEHLGKRHRPLVGGQVERRNAAQGQCRDDAERAEAHPRRGEEVGALLR
jgi:hypothetical protein